MSRRSRRASTPRHDAIASVRAEMDRADAHRLRTIRLAVGSAALALLVLALFGAAMIGSGESSAEEAIAVRAAAVQPAAVQPAPVPPAAEQPAAVPAIPVDPPSEQSPEPVPTPPPSVAVQRLNVGIGTAGYEPTVASAKAGIPIELTVAQGEGCAAGFLIPELGIELDNSTAPATENLGALEAGDYRFTCGMQMVEGVLQVR